MFAQCRTVKISILGDEGVPVQVDGEAWIQPPGYIRIIHKNRAQTLTRDRVRRLPAGPGEGLGARLWVHLCPFYGKTWGLLTFCSRNVLITLFRYKDEVNRAVIWGAFPSPPV